MTIQMKDLGENMEEKLNFMEKNVEVMREAVRSLIEESFSKDNASQTTNSKDSISLTSQKTDNIDPKKEDSMFSDYFFYPS